MQSFGFVTKPPTTFRLDDDVAEAMEALKERDGIPFNAQANRALREWLEQKGVLKKTKK